MGEERPRLWRIVAVVLIAGGVALIAVGRRRLGGPEGQPAIGSFDLWPPVPRKAPDAA
jgi:hypothetical protein